MQAIAKLIHRATASFLPIAFPALYFGMPNGKIYVLFSRFYEVKFEGSGLEFVFAEHKEFDYDYEKEEVITAKKFGLSKPVFAEMVDTPNTKLNVLKIYRGLNSYGEAVNLLNREANKMYSYDLEEAITNVS